MALMLIAETKATCGNAGCNWSITEARLRADQSIPGAASEHMDKCPKRERQQ